MSMKSNIFSPAALGGSPRSSARMDTRAKIIERVRGGGRRSPFPAFNLALSAEENSTNNFEVAYNSRTELDKATQHQTDDISVPTTASNSQDSRDDSVPRNAIVMEGDTHDPSSVLTDIVTNINDPGVGFSNKIFADDSINASIHYTVEEFTPAGKKKVSLDDNSILEEDESESSSPPKRRLFACGGADLGNELIEDLNATIRQIMSPMKNVKAVRSFVPEKNELKEIVKEKIISFKGRRSSSAGDAKKESEVREESTSYSGNSEKILSESDAGWRKRSDRIRVGSPEFKAMMSRRKEV